MNLSFLSQSIAGYRLEGLFYVDSFFGARFKVRNLVLRVTPLLCSFSWHGSIFQINLNE